MVHQRVKIWPRCPENVMPVAMIYEWLRRRNGETGQGFLQVSIIKYLSECNESIDSGGSNRRYFALDRIKKLSKYLLYQVLLVFLKRLEEFLF